MMIAGVLVGHTVNHMTDSEWGSRPYDTSKSGVLSWLEEQLGRSNKSRSKLNIGVDILDSCWNFIEVIPELAIYELVPTLRNARTLAMAIAITTVSFMNVVVDDILISVLTLGVSGLLLMESIIEFRYFEKEIPMLSLVVSGTGIATSSLSLCIV